MPRAAPELLVFGDSNDYQPLQGRGDLKAYSDAINKMKEKPMTDETQGAAAPVLTLTNVTDAEAAAIAQQGPGGIIAAQPELTAITAPAVEGVDAWAAALELHGISAENAKTLAANCLRDGYAQGVKAVPQDMTATEAYMRAQERLSAEKGITFFERLEDDVIWAAEEAAYHASNLVAEARGRKPDDGIDAWRKRTGGLRGLHHGA